MTPLDSELRARLDALAAAGLRRELRPVETAPGRELVHHGRRLLNFGGNDYLGLASHPVLVEAATRALRDFGAGSTASRLICGSLAPHHDLEATLAAWKQVPAVLTFSSGYAAALGAVTAVVGRDDVVLVDRLVHACCLDAARLSGATLRVFRHNDAEDLERVLRRLRSPEGSARRRILVITESVFSMDGDQAPLRELVEAKDRHGAWLMLDEAHATGLFGVRRSGLAEAAGLTERIDLHLGTLGKALGAAGGYIGGSKTLVEYLVHQGRSFVFSTAPVPAAAAAARAAVELVASSEGQKRAERVWALAYQLTGQLQAAGLALPPAASSICAIQLGSESRASTVAQTLRELSLFVPAIRYPTVAKGSARLRASLNAHLRPEDVATLVTHLHPLLHVA